MTTTHSQAHDLSTGQLQVALRLAALPPSKYSPFAKLTPPAAIDPAVLGSLRAAGVVTGAGQITDSWNAALAALAQPEQRISLFLGAAEGWNAIEYFSRQGMLAGYSGAGGNHRVTFPCPVTGILADLSDWLRIHEAGAVPPVFETDLQPEELTALSAIVDAYREENLRAFLERRQANPSRFSREQLRFELDAAAQADPRWYASLLTLHAPPPFAPLAERLDMGVRALATRGWLGFEEDCVVPEAALAEVCVGLGNLNPYAVAGAGPVGESGTMVLATKAVQGYWTLQFRAGGGRQVARLECVGGTGLMAQLEALLGVAPAPVAALSWTDPIALPVPTPAPAPTLPAPMLSAPMLSAPMLSAPMLSAPARPPMLTVSANCGKCGKARLSGRAFCSGCGAPYGPERS